MDPALKQRLLGAAVLIALAIIFVPMFLSNSPQKQESTTVNLAIPPEPDHKFEVRTLPVAEPSAPVANAPATPADPNKVVTVDTNAPRQVDAHPEDNTPPPAIAANTPKPAVPEPVKAAPAAPEPAAAPEDTPSIPAAPHWRAANDATTDAPSPARRSGRPRPP